MPTLRNQDGQEYDVSDVDAVKMQHADPSLQIVGDVRVTPGEEGQAPVSVASKAVTEQVGKTPATEATQQAHSRQKYLEGKTSAPGAILRGGLSGASFGLSDVFDPEQAEADRAVHGGLRFASELGGALVPGMFGDEAGLAKAAALADDPVALEHAGASLSSKMLYGGEVASDAGSLERGLARASRASDVSDISELAAARDAKGLSAAHKAELADIEAARVPQRAELVDDLATFRRGLKEDEKVFLATKGIKEAELPEGAQGMLKIQEIGKKSLDADRQLDRLLNNPKALAVRPQRAMDALQLQENALEHLQTREPTLREMFAADTRPERMAALDAVPGALERNRALQQRIQALVAEPSSARLSAIEDAKAGLQAGGGKSSFMEDMLGGSIMGHVSGALSGLPIIGPALGAKAGQLAKELVFGNMGKTVAKGAKAATAAVEKFGTVAARAAPSLVPAASRVLSQVSFGSSEKPSKAPSDVPALFKARTDEIKTQTAYNSATGAPEMRPEARQAMADRLAPIRAVSPVIADRLETIGARRIEYLSSIIPRKPDFMAASIGPDKWQPSNFEMRSFARSVDAVEDPSGVEARLADGSISPEDAAAYRAVYPERHAALTQQIMQSIPKRETPLSYKNRLALSVFTGKAIDPSLDPQVLAVLQGQYEAEEGSQGGTQVPTPAPQFGSVRADIGTASQQREAGMK
jgi:hypothetical protein